MKIGDFEDVLQQISTINELIKDFNYYNKKPNLVPFGIGFYCEDYYELDDNQNLYKKPIQDLLRKYNIETIPDLKNDDLKKFQKEFYKLINVIKKKEERMIEDYQAFIAENQFNIY